MAMKFALFYEIPVARPWTPRASTRRTRTRSSRPSSATRWASTRSGRSSTTSSRSTRTARTPRCSTARSRRAPRTSASATACGCCRSRTTTRSAPPSRSRCSTSSPTAGSTSAPVARRRAPSSRASTSTPTRRARCGARRSATSSARGPRTSTRPTGKYWQMGAPRRVQPKPLQQPHPPIFGATSSPDGHKEIGRHGLGLCSFTVGLPPEQLAERHRDVPRGPRRSARSRRASSSTTPRPRSRWCTARPTTEEAYEVAEESFDVVPEARRRAHRVRSPSGWKGKDLGTYQYTADALEARNATGAIEPPHDRLPARDAARRSWATPTSASRRRSATRRSAATCSSAS